MKTFFSKNCLAKRERVCLLPQARFKENHILEKKLMLYYKVISLQNPVAEFKENILEKNHFPKVVLGFIINAYLWLSFLSF